MLTLVSIKNNVNALKERMREKKEEALFCLCTHIFIFFSYTTGQKREKSDIYVYLSHLDLESKPIPI